jgi:hypothetical protein
MDLNIFKISAILGLLCIILAITLTKQTQKRKQFILYIIGGILLEVYSVYIKDTIFIILQAAFTISAIYELSMLYTRAKKLKKSVKEYLIHLEKNIIKLN